MTTDLTDRVAVVTGAAGLLGREHCGALAEAGATVVAADIDVDGATEAVDRPGDHLAVELDVTEVESVRRLTKIVISRHRRVDVLVNNAAINDTVEGHDEQPIPFEDVPLDRWQRSIDVNLTGVFLMSQAVGSEMARQGSGSIINIASTYALVGPDQDLYLTESGERLMFKAPAYSAAKGGVLAFTRYLATYWGDAGVRVNALSPGGVENGQTQHFVSAYSRRTPLGRMARASDYRGALLFLASDESAYMTGANLVVDGGWTAW